MNSLLIASRLTLCDQWLASNHCQSVWLLIKLLVVSQMDSNDPKAVDNSNESSDIGQIASINDSIPNQKKSKRKDEKCSNDTLRLKFLRNGNFWRLRSVSHRLGYDVSHVNHFSYFISIAFQMAFYFRFKIQFQFISSMFYHKMFISTDLNIWLSVRLLSVHYCSCD